MNNKCRESKTNYNEQKSGKLRDFLFPGKEGIVMIIVRIYEGLGNQMFEYAYAYALNKEMRTNDIQVYIDMRIEPITIFDKMRMYRPLEIEQFNITMPVATSKMLKHWFYIEKKTILCKAIIALDKLDLWKYKVFVEDDFNGKYLKIKNNSYVIGWFQHYQYFDKYRKDLLKEFQLKKEWKIPEQIQDIMSKYQVIALHVRRGDYVTDPVVLKNIGVCSRNYYISAVEYLKKKADNPYLFIFTNDEKWVNENLHFDIPSIIISDHFNLSDIQEMVLMSKCNHNIISNSTFSWWGAWLNIHKDKIVIAPKRWFKNRKRKNIAMKNWIKL